MRTDLLDLKEKHIEAYLVRKIREYGGLTRKFVSPQYSAVMDRICILNRITFFVECKAPGKKLTPAQAREAEEFRAVGGEVWMVDTKEKINWLIVYYLVFR